MLYQPNFMVILTNYTLSPIIIIIYIYTIGGKQKNDLFRADFLSRSFYIESKRIGDR